MFLISFHLLNMCGITGVFGFEDKDLLKEMVGILKHRGPDSKGYFLDKNIMLGHSRLSIIDLSEKGNQPLFNEDKSMAIIANGEVYNFKSIRNELEKKGHRFSSDTDSEVILHSYEEYGLDFVKLLNGCFAFAIWDSNKKQMILARDRHGMKPLFYTFNNGNFLFGSEIKAILMHKDVKREIDPICINYFVNLRYFPRDSTPFFGIKKFLPAYIMVLDKNGIVSYEEYWRPKLDFTNESFDAIVSNVDKKLEEAVKLKMTSDVPVAFLLSGGIDSSSLVAYASKLVDTPLKTYTMGFGEEQDEIKDAQVIADYFKTDHEVLSMKTNLIKDSPKLIWHADHPKRNLYPYYISKLISGKVKVVLGGIGADELFGGYSWKYVVSNLALDTRKNLDVSGMKNEVVESARKILQYQTRHGFIEDDRFLEYIKRLANIDNNTELYFIFKTLDEVYNNHYLNRIYHEDFFEKIQEPYDKIKKIYETYFNNNHSFVDQVLLTDYSVKLKDDFLFVDDHMTMANSLESRSPFLENNLVDYSFTIPYKYKIFNLSNYQQGNHIGKFVLRMAVKDKLPSRVFDKPKQGWGSDVFVTYKTELKQFAQSLPESSIVKDKIIKKDYIHNILNHYESRNLIKHYCTIWNLFAFEIWNKMYIHDTNIKNPNFNINNYLN